MKRNGRHRDGTHAKRRRARIARRLNLVRWRRALPVLIDGLAKMEAAIFEKEYASSPWTLIDGGSKFERYCEPMTYDVILNATNHAEGTLEPGDFEKFDTWARGIDFAGPSSAPGPEAWAAQAAKPSALPEEEVNRVMAKAWGDPQPEPAHIPAYLRTPAPMSPKQERAAEILRLVGEGKIRVIPPLPDPFDKGDS